jgi:hypothetical protein
MNVDHSTNSRATVTRIAHICRPVALFHTRDRSTAATPLAAQRRLHDADLAKATSFAARTDVFGAFTGLVDARAAFGLSLNPSRGERQKQCGGGHSKQGFHRHLRATAGMNQPAHVNPISRSRVPGHRSRRVRKTYPRRRCSLITALAQPRFSSRQPPLQTPIQNGARASIMVGARRPD